MIIDFLIISTLILTLLYYRATLSVWAAVSGAVFAGLGYRHGLSFGLVFMGLTVLSGCVLFSIQSFRFKFFTIPLYHFAKMQLPTISKSEEEALKAGTIGWEGEIFSGILNWEKLYTYRKPTLSQEEQAFLEGPIEEICRNPHSVWDMWHKDLNFPKDLQQLIYQHGVLAMIVPKEYGGKGFSVYGAWSAHLKISKRIGPLINLVSIANSIAAGELIEHYGTREQKEYYLPRLADGREIPCFALTSPVAGSDATSIEDYGVVARDLYEGKEVLGIRLNFSKRYITMAPLATIASLAFKLYDPDHLLGERESLGVTLAIVPMGLPGIQHDRRHYPVGGAFPNGPLQGRDVFVPLGHILGGQEMIGRAWEMLTQALATGRATSLPTVAVSNIKTCFYLTTLYTLLRKQFGVAIGSFEGVKEKLAEMAGYAYLSDALRLFTFSQIEAGEKPAIPAAISKYNTTEWARRTAIHAVDLMGGKAVMQGPHNHVATAYLAAPVAVTIEGSNTLTRSLIVFGQGAVRCHPFILKEMNALKQDDVQAFDQLIFQHARHSLSLLVRSFFHGFTRGHAMKLPRCCKVLLASHKSMARLSLVYALVSDLTMILQGGKLKGMEALSGKFADALSMLFTTSATLKHFDDKGAPQDIAPIVDWSLRWTLHHAEQNLYEILDNHPNPWIAQVLRWVVFPWGRMHKKPSDRLSMMVAELVQSSQEVRQSLADGLYFSADPSNPLYEYEQALRVLDDVDPLYDKIYKNAKAGLLKGYTFNDRLQEALKIQLLNKAEAEQLLSAHQVIMNILNVDDFSFDELHQQK